jgi:hypothetical protein
MRPFIWTSVGSSPRPAINFDRSGTTELHVASPSKGGSASLLVRSERAFLTADSAPLDAQRKVAGNLHLLPYRSSSLREKAPPSFEGEATVETTVPGTEGDDYRNMTGGGPPARPALKVAA